MTSFHFLRHIHGKLVIEFIAKLSSVVNSLLNFYLLNSTTKRNCARICFIDIRRRAVWGNNIELSFCHLRAQPIESFSDKDDSSRMPLTWCLCNLSDGNKHPLKMKKQLASLSLILFALTTSPRLVNFSSPGERSSHVFMVNTACARAKHNIAIYRRKELMPTSAGNCK